MVGDRMGSRLTKYTRCRTRCDSRLTKQFGRECWASRNEKCAMMAKQRGKMIDRQASLYAGSPRSEVVIPVAQLGRQLIYFLAPKDDLVVVGSVQDDGRLGVIWPIACLADSFPKCALIVRRRRGPGSRPMKRRQAGVHIPMKQQHFRIYGRGRQLIQARNVKV